MSIHVLAGAVLCFIFMYLVARLGTDWRAWLARSAIALVLTIIMVEASGMTYHAARYSGLEWARFVVSFAAIAYFTVSVVELAARVLMSRFKNE